METSEASRGQKKVQIAAYDALARMFLANIDKVLDIEILPSTARGPNGQLFFEDELGVGIPKTVLVAAFVQAREIFATRTTIPDDQSSHDARTATPIILLFDPEYLTAANFRKKHLLHASKREGFDIDLKRELIFLDSVLTSPLHRQSKSPTLWYHRYWIISTFLGQLCLEEHFNKDFFKHEISIIFRSAERHQHNYYAWQYARRLISLLAPTISKHMSMEICVTDDLINETFAWCLQHPSDTSGWSFLFLLMQESMPNTHQITLIVQKTAEFASSYRWSKEALWHFMRTTLLLTSLVPEDIRTHLIKSTGVKALGSSTPTLVSL